MNPGTLRTSIIKPVILLGFLTVSLVGRSQHDTVDVNELIKLSLDELVNLSVSSASKIGQKINEAPSVVSLVGRDDLQKYQWISLNDIASRQAGYTVGQDRFNRTIVSRGINDLLWSKRLLVLFDGVPFSTFQSTVTDEALSLNMAKSVELVRGPGGVLYGTQAVTGVAQVNSLSFADLKHNGTVEVKAGNADTRNLNLITGVKGKQFNAILSFNNYSTNGNEYMSYDALLKRDSSGSFIKQMTQDERTSSHFWAKIEGKDKLSGLSLNYHLQNYTFQMGHGFLTIFPEVEATSRVNRNYIMAKYVSPSTSKKIKHEYVLKYDYEITEMNMQILPAGFARRYQTGTDSTNKPVYATDSAGIWEQYIVPVNNAFARAQWIYFMPRKMTLLGGIEQDFVLYKGDKVHYSNVNLSDRSLPPFRLGEMGPVEPLYERIKNKPINNTGIYAQYTSGSLLGDKLTATLGFRYDMYYYRYKNLVTERDTSRFQRHLSPRIVFVYRLGKDFSLRAMYANAFRMASPFEQFLSNSIISGVNQTDIKPEVINTYELSADYTLNKKLNWRNTVFHSDFSDQIRLSRGIFTNVINTRHRGMESEVSYHGRAASGFLNYSFVQRLSETSTDTALKVSNTLIWYPAHAVNVGMSYLWRKAELSVQAHYQSAVDRRSSEKGAPLTGGHKGINMDELRGAKVPSWYTVDVNVRYQISDKLNMRVTATNLFDKKYNLINTLGGNSPQPFDYQQAGRRLLVSMMLNF